MCTVINSYRKLKILQSNDSLVNSLEVFHPQDNGLVMVDTFKVKGEPGFKNLTLLFEVHTKKKNMTITAFV
jgi:hypothetical protein